MKKTSQFTSTIGSTNLMLPKSNPKDGLTSFTQIGAKSWNGLAAEFIPVSSLNRLNMLNVCTLFATRPSLIQNFYFKHTVGIFIHHALNSDKVNLFSITF